MDTPTFNTLYLLFTGLAVILSLLSIVVSFVSNFKAEIIATEANKIAREALSIAIKEHQTEHHPLLIMKYYLLHTNYNINHISFLLINESWGMAKILNLNPFNYANSFLSKPINDNQGTIHLGLNCQTEYLFELKNIDEEIEKIQQTQHWKKKHEIAKKLYREKIEKCQFKVTYKDQFEKHYEILLSYSESETKFTGKPKELSSTNPS